MRLVFTILFLGILVSAWAANVFLGDLAEDDNARIRREHAERSDVLMPSAESGSANAQYELGKHFLFTDDLVRDPAISFGWFQRAAVSGHAEAQYELGRMYEEGQGIQQNYELAARWYARSAEAANSPEAQYALGQLNFRGLVPGHNRTKALELFKRAAENGQPVAQYLVGRMYDSGWGVRVDPVEAYKWYSLAERHRKRVLKESIEYDPAKARDRISLSMNQSQRDVANKAIEAWIATHN